MNLTQVKGNTWVIEANQLIPLYKLEDGRCVLLDSGLLEEREELEEKRRAERPAAMWPSFLWLTVFQLLSCVQLMIAAGEDASPSPAPGLSGPHGGDVALRPGSAPLPPGGL